MEAAKQPRDSGFEPAVTDVAARKGQDLFEIGAYGDLMRRAKEQPLSFTFDWRGTDFMGTVESIDDGMRLSLRSSLATLPYSAENAAARGELLAVVDTYAGGGDAKLMVYQGHKVMLEHEIVLPPSLGDTVTTIVTQLTMLVLNTAAYLDLIVEFSSPPTEA
ncbi:MAG: hypothetical protein IIB67_01050 [Proteobacteria bacterium]|nr:hypothetical protein [Pseudomonadota bacterium]